MHTATRVALEEAVWRLVFGGLLPAIITKFAIGEGIAIGNETLYLPLWLGAALLMMLVAFGLFISDWIVKYRRGLPRTNRGMYRRLREWADVAGLQFQGNPQDGAHFAFVVQDEWGRKVNVIRSRVSSDALWFADRIEISPEQQRTIRSYTQQEIQRIGDEIKDVLLLLGVGTKMKDFPSSVEVNNLVDIGAIRNRVNFLNELMLIKRATAAVVDRIRRATQLWPPTTGSGD